MSARTVAVVPPPAVAGRVSRPAVLAVVALFVCADVAATVALAATSDHLPNPVVRGALAEWIILGYLSAGLIAWWRRPDSRLGPLMLAAGVLASVAKLSWANAPVPSTIGELLDFLQPVLFIHVFLAYPSGRLRSRVERVFVAAAYAAALALQLGRLLLDDAGQRNAIAVASQPVAATVVLDVLLCSVAALALAAIGVLALRRRRSGRPLRRSFDLMIDSFALALVLIAALFLSIVLGGPGVEEIRRATFFVIGLAPIVFLVGLVGARLARATVGELVVELRGRPAPAGLRDAVARALRDPSLELAYWLPEFGCYGDLDGSPVELPTDGSRAATRIDRDGARLALLVHDPELGEEPELLEAVTAAGAIALENEQLQAELRARMRELRGSRARILEAGQRERQRLERNLHDGAQQRLIALSLELGRLEGQLAGNEHATARLEHARREIAASLDELRAVSHGLHPVVVSAHGLDVALEQLVALAPLPVRLRAEVTGRLPEPLEVAAYYIVSESLANVGKHARASAAEVEVLRGEAELVVEVRDDGVGGADTAGGSGLRGLADRVETLGGRLRVWSPSGGGTRLRAEIPCA
jgi:signal transduction histidine kinase